MMSAAIFTTRVNDPRAIAIVLGHLGASSATLERYSDYYIRRGCSVIATTSPVRRFMLNQTIRPTAVEVIRRVVGELKVISSSAEKNDNNLGTISYPGGPAEAQDDIPIIVHTFSNGGMFVLEQIHVILEEEADEIEQKDDDVLLSREEKQMVASRMKQGCQINDSCPCYIRPVWDVTGYDKAFPHPRWSSLSRACYTAGASLSLTLWCTLTFAIDRPTQFWQRMRDSQLCLHQVYMYSTCDMASDASKVEELIKYRRERYGGTDAGINIVVYRCDDSGHCRLDLDHPKEYGAVIDHALEASVARAKADAGVAAG